MKKWLLGFLVLILLFILSLIIYLGAPYNPDESTYIDAEPPNNLVRTIHNPDAGNTVTFLEKSHETDGEYTLLEIELQPGGGNTPHYHSRFSEDFTAIDGTVGIEMEGEEILLDESNSAKAEAGEVHRFFNPGEEPVMFEVLIEPGSPGFEKALYILYGLANDNLTNDDGIPHNLHHTAVFATYSDTRATGIQGMILGPIIDRLAGRAQRTGIEKDILDRYYFSMTE